jgi:uncharacterized membrane protein YraQ (UPF0718 family)
VTITNENFFKALKKTWKQFSSALYIIFIVFGVVAILSNLITPQVYTSFFSKNIFSDSLIGTVLGSISFGNSIGSYVLGGELLKNGVDIVAVTSFLLAWVTVGFAQLPVEAHFLGKRFALVRNAVSFFATIILAILINLVLRLW